MVIKNVNEKYNSLMELGLCENASSFVFCYFKDEKNDEIDIVPIYNDIKNANMSSNNMMITDKFGNLLLDLKDFNYDNVLINYVNGNDLIVSNYTLIKPQYVYKKVYNSINHYVYNDIEKNIVLKERFFINNDNRLINFEMLNDKKDVFLIETIDNFHRKARLYSVSKRKYITPDFTKIEYVENTNYELLKYTDNVESNLLINDISFNSNIIGFITIDGIFYNGVYDEITNKEIECELNSKPNFEEYYNLKKMIQGKLDEKVIKESNKQMTKNFIIKKLENKAKRNF